MSGFRGRACLSLLIGLGARGAMAQPDPCEDNPNAGDLPLVPQDGSTCVGRSFMGGTFADPEWMTESIPPGADTFLSSCWSTLLAPYTQTASLGLAVPDGTPAGFRLGYYLLESPSPGDFLPPAPTIGGSSVCLLPPGAGGLPTSWQNIGRPTLGGSVDLVTGLPLVQVTDLELPFGGATFRLTRTRSGNHARQQLETNFKALGSDRWWDWTGAGWMIGENPLLLIDAALPDVTGDAPRTCWLVLDAHHSIPFQLIESNGVYEAPPRFRARISHNGQWDAGGPDGIREWATRPTQYKVSLYDGQVTYTFGAILNADGAPSDIPPKVWDESYLNGGDPTETPSSYHDRPFTPNQFNNAGVTDGREVGHDPYSSDVNPGFGIPYMGLCTRVEDQHGHVVEISYVETGQGELDQASSDCTECRQGCASRGQIRSVRLKSKDDQGQWVTNWTLLYVHRMVVEQTRFMDGAVASWVKAEYPASNAANDEKYFIHAESELDTIYVYEGQVSDGAIHTISHREQPYWKNGVIDLDGGADVMTGWRHRVRYHYAPHANTSDPSLTDELGSVPGSGLPLIGRPMLPALLVKTSVRSVPGVAGQDTVRESVFHYAEASSDTVNPWMDMVFTGEDIDRLLDASRNTTDGDSIRADLRVNDLAMWTAEGGLFLGAEADDVMRFASIRVDPSPLSNWPTIPHPDAPTMESLSSEEYLRLGGLLIGNDSHDQVVGVASLREGGELRHYRVMRLAVKDGEPSQGPPTFAHNFDWSQEAGLYQQSLRSVFAHPFAWHGYMRGGSLGDRSLTASPELSRARWVVIVDEFADRDAMLELSVNYGGSDATKAGQMSRRVVEMNATGYILRDHTWEFDEDGFTIAGTGLGEEFIYRTIEEYLVESGQAPLPPAPTTDGPDEDMLIDPDPYEALRRELVLVEHRSVGWSAGSPDWNDPNEADGLTHFFEYVQFGGWPVDGKVPEGGIPLASRVQLASEGLRRGTSFGNASNVNPKLYRRQLFRNAAAPTDLVCQVEFLEPATALMATPPAMDQPGPYHEFAWKATHTISEYEEDAQKPPTEWRAKSRMIVGPPRQMRPGGEWYYPVEREFYHPDGSTWWSVTGQLRDPLDPGADASDPLASLTFTWYFRDSMGRTVFTVADAGGGATIDAPSGNGSVTTDAYPSAYGYPGWARIGAVAAVNSVTQYAYDMLGLTDVYFPNGRRWARRVIQIEGAINEGDDPTLHALEFVFNDLVESSPGLFTAESPGDVNEYRERRAEGTPVHSKRVNFQAGFGLDFDEIAEAPGYTEMWRVQVAPDADGRIARAELLEPDPNGAMLAVGSKEVNDLGEVVREREIDGTVTRRTRNSIGQVLRTYVGTNDLTWTSNAYNAATNNLVLVERVEYGAEINDAWLPTISRRYESIPASWNSYDYHGVPPVVDPDGIATATSYDWRMRPVRVDSYTKGFSSGSASRLSTSLTFLDHADRPRLVVTFGKNALDASSLGALDPTTLLDDDPIPPASAFLALSPKPTSVVEMSYGPDGGVTARKTYDLTSSTARALVEYTLSGPGGQAVFQQRPGQPVQITRLDNLGRIASSSDVRPTSGSDPYAHELTRTDYVHDGDGNVVETARWERVLPSGDELDATNAVRTRSVSWFDAHKRLIASADLGTEDETGYVYHATGYVRGAAPSYVRLEGQSIIVDREGLPDSAMLSLYGYDQSGNQVFSVDPRGIGTQLNYGRAGRLAGRIENADTTEPELRRITSYEYEYGRVVGIKATRANSPNGGPAEIEDTIVEYGASIVNAAFAPVSWNNALVGIMKLPQGGGGTGTQEVLRFTYTFSGQVAERIDGRGVVFRYAYDALGRLSTIRVGWYNASGAFNEGYPASMNPPNQADTPVDRIVYVLHEYDTAGRLWKVTAKAGSTPLAKVVAQNVYLYDANGNLLEEKQSIGKLAGTNTPKTTYAWAYDPTQPLSNPNQSGGIGYNRLASIGYPSHPSFDTRTVSLSYGPAGSDDDTLSRLRAMSTNVAGGPVHPVASFAYAGTSRRDTLTLGDLDITQTWRGAPGVVGLPGLDNFGRPGDLHYTNESLDTLFRARYTYDIGGNRMTAELTHVNADGSPRANVLSQVNAYDQLGRLVSTDVGAIAWSGGSYGVGTPTINPATRERLDRWQLDLLGNWTGSADNGMPGASEGRRAEGNLDGFARAWEVDGADSADDVVAATQEVDLRNRITSLQTTDSGGGSNPIVEPGYDLAGNLVFDGDYYYQYDAWNRLLQVNRAEAGEGGGPPVVGVMLKHYMFDGVGRLVRTQSPWPDADSAEGEVRSERFYYDGVRRIQEVITDPVAPIGEALSSGDPTLESAAGEQVAAGESEESSAAPVGLEDEQLMGAGGGGGEGGQNNAEGGSPPPAAGGELNREYIWGPGDGLAGVDEMFCQLDGDGELTFTLQDAGGDICCVAIPGSGGGGGASTRVAAQYSYDAYGNVSTAEVFEDHPRLHAGHKGLFADRLDAGVVYDGGGGGGGGGGSYIEAARFVTFSKLIHQNRNRAYAPGLGRFLQSDPNATAMAVMGSAAYHARSAVADSIESFSVESLYGDGHNIYEYLRSSPWLAFDALGLAQDPFDIVDEYLAADAASKAAFMNQLGMGVRAIAVVAATIASYLPFPPLSAAGELALYALGEQSAMQTSLGISLGLIPGSKLAVKFGSLLGGIRTAVWNNAVHYAQRFGGPLLSAGRWVLGLTKSAIQWAARKFSDDAVLLGPLDWSIVSKKGETRWEHVQRHGTNNLSRNVPHGVYYDDPVLTTEEAWARAQRLGIAPGSNGQLLVNMGRPVGYEGGKVGSGVILTNVRIILVPGTTRIITSYPE